jgi:hypothetical protein
MKVTKEVIQEMAANPRLSVRDQSATCGLNVKTIWEERHRNGYHFYQEIKTTPLTPQHKENRANFCNVHAREPLQEAIIFSDKSTIGQNLGRGGLWRRRGEHIPECFAPVEAHPRQIMIWGAIGPGGYRSPLIWLREAVNQLTYLQMFSEHDLIPLFLGEYGEGKFVFQQDNASPHSAVRVDLEQLMPILDWPPRCPDLSPIEQIWAYLKRKIRGKTFSSDEELFAELQRLWNEIPDSLINKLISSFRARCIVCARHGGASLNGHWAEVRREQQKLLVQATAQANQ